MLDFNMAEKKKLRPDVNEIAHRVMLEATGQAPKTPPPQRAIRRREGSRSRGPWIQGLLGGASCPTVRLPVVLPSVKVTCVTLPIDTFRVVTEPGDTHERRQEDDPLNRGTPMSGGKKTTRYPPATAANGATAEAIAKALLTPLAPLPPKK